MKEYSKFHSADYSKPLEISHWEALQRLKSLLELPTATIVILQSDTYVTAGKTLRHLRNILDRLEGIGRGCDNGMETRAAMVLANGVRHKLKVELKDDGAVLFGLSLLAYLDIGGDDFSYHFPLFYILSFFIFRGVLSLFLCIFFYLETK